MRRTTFKDKGPHAQYHDVCLVDVLRAHGFKVEYVANGPFWAMQDGSKFLVPWQCLDSTMLSLEGMSFFVQFHGFSWLFLAENDIRREVAAVDVEALEAGIATHGRYILAHNEHFVALRFLVDEGWAINFTNKRHLWQPCSFSSHPGSEPYHYSRRLGAWHINLAAFDGLFTIRERPLQDESHVLGPDASGGGKRGAPASHNVIEEKLDIDQHVLASDIHGFLVQDLGQTQRFQPYSQFGALTDRFLTAYNTAAWVFFLYVKSDTPVASLLNLAARLPCVVASDFLILASKRQTTLMQHSSYLFLQGLLMLGGRVQNSDLWADPEFSTKIAYCVLPGKLVPVPRPTKALHEAGVFWLKYKGVECFWITCPDSGGQVHCGDITAKTNAHLVEALNQSDAEVMQFLPEALLVQLALLTIQSWDTQAYEEPHHEDASSTNRRDVNGGGAKPDGNISGTASDARVPNCKSALIIHQEWCTKILEGTKVWEIRGEVCRKRERIAILEQGTWHLVGEVDIIDCLEVGQRDAEGHWVPCHEVEHFIWSEHNLEKHQIQEPLSYKRAYAWVLKNPSKYDQPRKLAYKKGWQKWVKLSPKSHPDALSREAETGPEAQRWSKQSEAPWPALADAALFEATQTFAPQELVLVESSEVPLPPEVPRGSCWLTANTTGDGACAMHALFGEAHHSGQLYCEQARSLAARALEEALAPAEQEQSPAFIKAVRASVWSELVRPGAAGGGGPETKAFWKILEKQRPSYVSAVKARCAQTEHSTHTLQEARMSLNTACRLFFLESDVQQVKQMLGLLNYMEYEAMESCIEQRLGCSLVKGSGVAYVAGMPETKLEALFCPLEAFDGLRRSLLLQTGSAILEPALDATGLNTVNGIGLVSALRAYENTRQHVHLQDPELPELKAVVHATYMQALQDDQYFFSCDELASIAWQLRQSLLIVADGSESTCIPCVHVPMESQLRVVRLRRPAGELRVRSHFERMARADVVKSLSVPHHHVLEDNYEQESALVAPTKATTEASIVKNELLNPQDEETNVGANHEHKFKPVGPSGKSDLLNPQDGQAELDAAVESLLEAFGRGEDYDVVLEALPLFSSEIADATWSHMCARLRFAVTEYTKCNITGADAVYLATPFWRTCPFPLAVLCEAWSRTTGLPTVFYLDAIYTLVSSLLKKDVTYRVSNFSCRARYWAVGTAAPGAGKSPALEPLKRALVEVMQELPDLAPGVAGDNFHVQPIGTHMAAVDRLRQTGGYQFFGASEGGPVLCPAWPTSATWNQGTHINWQRYLDAATGDSVPWETAVDRQKRRHSADGSTEDPQQTNVSVFILQQVSLFSNWWAAAEDRCSVGLTGRFAFSFASAGEPGAPKMALFGEVVVLPRIKRIFRFMLKSLGPHAPLPTDSRLLSWSGSEAAQEEVHRYRVLCHELTRMLHMDETFASCLNKNGYWLSVVAFWNNLLAQIWPSITTNDEAPALTPAITDVAVRSSMDFFTFRFLYGASVLCADMRRRSWQRVKRANIIADDTRWNVGAALLLKSSCGSAVTPEAATRAGPMFRNLLEGTASDSAKAAKAFMEALEFLADRGFGEIQPCPHSKTQWPMFVKRHFHQLPESALKQLAEIHVHPISFGLHMYTLDGKAATRASGEAGDAALPEPNLSGWSNTEETEDHITERVRVQTAQQTVCVEELQVAESKEDTQKLVHHTKPNHSEPWVAVFEGASDSTDFSYTALRGHVEVALARQRDPGIYTFKDRTQRKAKIQKIQLYGECKPTACVQCTFNVRAQMTCQAQGLKIRVETRGKHGALALPQGGCLWTVTEWHVIQEALCDAERVGVKDIRQALSREGLPVRCSSTQLSSFTARLSKKLAGGTGAAKSHGCTVAELQAATSTLMLTEPIDWDGLPKSQLVVLPQSVFQTDRVCVLWTSPGMVQCAKGAQNKVVKFVVDGKQNLLRNNYTIMTLSFYVTSQRLQKTWVRKQHKASAEFWTGTQVPFLQAMMSTESEANVGLLFETAVAIGNRYCGLDLEKQVRQVHKDHARGIEAARKRVFKNSRPCDDFAHMRRQSHCKLKQMLGVHRRPSRAQFRNIDIGALNLLAVRSKKEMQDDTAHVYDKCACWP